MPLDAPLNRRQIDVLRWVSDGCPEGIWKDFTHKTTASALEWRGLITVSKRGGSWTASITPAGAHYLKTGIYPPGHRLRRIRPPRPSAVSSLTATSARPPKPSAPAAMKPTHQLVKDILDAGGVLERDVSEDTTNYKHLVSIINGRNIAPDDAQVIMNDWAKPRAIVLRFSSATWNWKSGTLPQRISKLHPIVAELRSDNRLDNIGTSLRPRAYRLLHALVREAEARGHKVRASKRPSQYGYGEQVGGIVGCLVFNVNDIRCALSVSEPQDRVPHVATETEMAKAKRDTWYRIPTHDYVKSGRLHLTLATDSGYHSKVGWQDTTKLRLESRLCDVIPLFEHWAAFDAERKEVERQRQIAAHERREREDAIALEAYTQQSLADRLVADLEAWELACRLRVYLSMLSERVGAMTDDGERSVAIEWLDWCETYVAEHDPATKAIAMPTVRPPAYGELAGFRKWLGFGVF